MGHSHPHHDHTESRRYAIVLLLAIIIFIMELVVGTIAHSLALVGDAWHVLADGGAILLALIIALYARTAHPERAAAVRKYGAYVQAGMLFIVCGWMIKEAFERLAAPKVLDLGWVITVAVIGTVGNYLQHHIVTHKNTGQNITKKALDVHILSDLAQSVAVVIGTALIALSKLPIIDPLLSFGIAIWMAIWTVRIVKEARSGVLHECGHHH